MQFGICNPIPRWVAPQQSSAMLQTAMLRYKVVCKIPNNTARNLPRNLTHRGIFCSKNHAKWPIRLVFLVVNASVSSHLYFGRAVAQNHEKVVCAAIVCGLDHHPVGSIQAFVIAAADYFSHFSLADSCLNCGALLSWSSPGSSWATWRRTHDICSRYNCPKRVILLFFVCACKVTERLCTLSAQRYEKWIIRMHEMPIVYCFNCL